MASNVTKQPSRWRDGEWNARVFPAILSTDCHGTAWQQRTNSFLAVLVEVATEIYEDGFHGPAWSIHHMTPERARQVLLEVSFTPGLREQYWVYHALGLGLLSGIARRSLASKDVETRWRCSHNLHRCRPSCNCTRSVTSQATGIFRAPTRGTSLRWIRCTC